MSKEIKLHTIATFQGKEYELEELLNGLLKENKQLKEDLEDYERIFDIWNKRKLIKKFNKDFSKKMVKEERAKGNKIVGAIPDAEYVYKKYYEKVEQIDKATEYLTSYSSIHTIQFGTENDNLNDIELNKTLDEKTLTEMTNRYLKVHDKLLEILKGEK